MQGLGQPATGALSDHWGRKPFVAGGMLLQAGALTVIASADTFALWAVAAALLGGHRGGLSHAAGRDRRRHPPGPANRSMGIYRLRRDGGFAVQAILGGVLADAYGIRTAHWPLRKSPPPRGCWPPRACMRHTSRRSAPTAGRTST